jgi:hypothetical protein
MIYSKEEEAMRARSAQTAALLKAGLWFVGFLLVPLDALAQGNPFVQLQNQIQALSDQIQDQHEVLENKLDTIDGKLDALAEAGGLVPFKVEAPGGICNTAAFPSANPEILIDSDGEDPFVVTSILIGTGPQNPSGYEFLSINSVRINGLLFDTRTGNLVAPVGGFGVNESADLMGTPIRRASLTADEEPGGNFPHQIVAEGTGTDDIEIQLFCRADSFDLDIDFVLVAGWQPPDDLITATYTPGN